ncbi:MAG: aldehyde oxygenase (deformylating) [Elainella sp. Prado103]|nr:aldehyde oxygenase (deformylating) [Elainella sp. Prado103]
MSQIRVNSTLDFHSDAYRDSFSRINGIVIAGEQEAHDNFIRLAELLPEHCDLLTRLGKMELRHRKSFEACGRNLNVTPDLPFAEQFFTPLRQAFQTVAGHQQVGACLLIQALIVECFAIAAYHNYIPVADDFARKVTESIVADEHEHLSFGVTWLKANFAEVKAELETTNRQILPIVRQMLNQVEADAEKIGMSKQALLEDFLGRYGEVLSQIGFTTREVIWLSSQGLRKA